MMSEKLVFDDGLVRLNVNDNGILCFAPGDFNLYQRFCSFLKELPEIEAQYKSGVEDVGAVPENASEAEQLEAAGKVLDKAREIDLTIKKRLGAVFGGTNDFDQLLGGVNLMSWAGNGERVITNFLNAITPYLDNGVKRYMKDAAAGAVEKAKQNRAKRPRRK